MSEPICKPLAAFCLGLLLVVRELPVHAWGDQGHRIIASIAYGRLAPATRKEVDSLLSEDKADRLTSPDFVSRATWADKLLEDRITLQKKNYNATRFWHFAEIGMTNGNLDAGCYRFPPLPEGRTASTGPAKDCVVHKVEQFAAELRSPDIARKEKIAALKFLVHLVGDLHQPLRVAENHDSFGSAVHVRSATGSNRANADLQSYWETELVNMMVRNAKGSEKAVADSLASSVTVSQAEKWTEGGPREWVIETVDVARTVVYDYAQTAQMTDLRRRTVLYIGSEYDNRATPAVKEQLTKAGIRLAWLLDVAFAPGSAGSTQPTDMAKP